MTLTHRQIQRINMLRATGESIRTIVKQTGYPRAQVAEACQMTTEQQRRNLLKSLRKMRPPERSEEVHERVIRGAFPEAFAEGVA